MFRGRALSLLVLAGVALTGLPAAAGAAFPALRPTTPSEAIEAICEGDPAAEACVRARLIAAASPAARSAADDSPAVSMLVSESPAARERTLAGPGGLRIRLPRDLAMPDRDADGTPDLVEATLEGLTQARTALVERLELPRPELTDLRLVELGATGEGYLLPGESRGRWTLVLDATPAAGPDGARRAAIRLYAYAVALASGAAFPADWAEAFSTWAVTLVDGGPDPRAAGAIDRRLARLHEGVFHAAPDRGAGNAGWFAFLHEFSGPAAVRATLEELGRPGPVAPALDRALRRVGAGDLTVALREFQIWSLFVGPRDDGRHFSFAGRLAPPVFSAERRGLPALSIQDEPRVAPLGAARARLIPDGAHGGLKVQFEGEFLARWEADLLLIRDDGAPWRVPIALSPEGRGQTVVPLDGLREVVLLVRNLGSEDGAPHRYSYTALADPGYPLDLVSLSAEPAESGVVVAWETADEDGVIAFNVLRRREEGGIETVVNPAWIPALGGPGDATTYRFLDRDAEPGVRYRYRLEAITATGLSTRSEPVAYGDLAPR